MKGILGLLLLFCVMSLSSATTDDTVDVYVPWNFNSGSEQVWYGDHLWYENYVGKQSYEYNVSFSYDSQYRICSNSKLFTAISILQLVENGVIGSIYDNINDYLDAGDLSAWGFPSGTTQYCPTVYGQTQNICQQGINMTFVSLLSMQSGVIDVITCGYSPSDWEYAYCINNVKEYVYFGSVAQTIQLFAANPLWTAPNIQYNITNMANLYSSVNENAYTYANENFIILSYFVEKLSNSSFQKYIKQNIIEPLQLNNTLYDPYSQEFLMQTKLASEYYFYTDLPFPPTENPYVPTGTYPPFAIGRCDAVEANPGLETGSGGMISTLPDMVKWYNSLFITKNASNIILSQASIDLLLYPWAISNNFPQYYGLGSEIMFSSTYTSPPPMSTWSAENLTTVFYMGGSMCSFFTIVIWNSTVNPFGGPPMNAATLPLTVAVGRNNRILNVTRDNWMIARDSRNGTWPMLTQNGNAFFQAQGWSDPECCGSTAPSLSDTEYVAFDLAWYFGTLTFGGQPTGKPVASPAQSYVYVDSADDDLSSTGMKVGSGAIALLVIFLVLGVGLIGFGGYYYGMKGRATTGGSSSSSHVANPSISSAGGLSMKENVEA
jgi:CubicO group peptidase (beta-lactamase class C family)